MKKSGGNNVFWRRHKPFANYIRENEKRWERNRKDKNKQRVLIAKILKALTKKLSDHDVAIREITKILKALL